MFITHTNKVYKIKDNKRENRIILETYLNHSISIVEIHDRGFNKC